MNIEEIVDYCARLKGATQSFPFDESTLVFKVMNKMFALIPLNANETSISLKCDPDWAIELREEYGSIEAAWHFNKTHWNSVKIDPEISVELLTKMINHSYDLIIQSLPKKLKEEYKLL